MFLTRASSLICNTNSQTYRINKYLSCFLSKAQKKRLEGQPKEDSILIKLQCLYQILAAASPEMCFVAHRKGKTTFPIGLIGGKGQAHASSLAPSCFRKELEYLLQGWSRDTDLDSERDWRMERPLWSTPSTEQGQILYCYNPEVRRGKMKTQRKMGQICKEKN